MAIAKVFTGNNLINGGCAITPTPMPSKSNYLLTPAGAQVYASGNALQVFVNEANRFLVRPSGWSH